MNPTNFVMAVGLALAVSGCGKKTYQESAPPVDESPVVHSDIPAKPPKGCGGVVLGIHYGDAYKTLREVEDFRPGARDYYVRELNDHRNEYFLAGISPSERKEWLTSHKWSEKDAACFGPLFDAIAAAAKKTLPNYQPRNYKYHEAGEDELIKTAIKADIPDAEFLDVGVSSPSWNIDKHGNGIPRSRYKYGMAWIKSKTFDDGYCRIAYVNIVGDYAGGSSYADSTGSYLSIEPAGCP